MIYDLRSDTVTQPSEEMRGAMMRASVGDHFYDEDPTVTLLEFEVANFFNFEAAAFFPTATMANQVALKLYTNPGDAIAGAAGLHISKYETGALAALGGINFLSCATPYNLPSIFEKANMKPALHAPHLKVMCFENTFLDAGGKIWNQQELIEQCTFTHNLGLKNHCDGARIWHAVAEKKCSPTLQSTLFDTLTVCFSKGLGAPAGSALLCKKENLFRVKQLRKMHGGTMRQSGILAAGALFGMQNNIEGLVQDHANAKNFYETAKSKFQNLLVPEFQNSAEYVPETNIVFLPCRGEREAAELQEKLWVENQTKVSSMSPRLLRAVFHRDARSV